MATAGCASDPPRAVVGVVADGCGPVSAVGTGVVVGDDLVATSAHTLRGADHIDVVAGGARYTAEVVGFDPDLDLAYLAAPLPPGIAPLDVGTSHEGRATAWAFRGGSVVAVPVEIVRPIRLETEDIYVEGATVRPAYELHASIRPGDSGGPVVVDGAVVALVWARSTRDDVVAYAIDLARGRARIDEQRATGDLGDDVDLARCD